jgi:hypothetical protein
VGVLIGVFAKLFYFRQCWAEKQAYFYFLPWYLAEIGGNSNPTINMAIGGERGGGAVKLPYLGHHIQPDVTTRATSNAFMFAVHKYKY